MKTLLTSKIIKFLIFLPGSILIVYFLFGLLNINDKAIVLAQFKDIRYPLNILYIFTFLALAAKILNGWAKKDVQNRLITARFTCLFFLSFLLSAFSYGIALFLFGLIR